MKLTEKLLLVFTALLIGAGVFCYTFNRDIYCSVGNMNPVKGYAEFVNSLSNEDFILSKYEGWSSSTSWVLRDLYQFLTEEAAELNAASLVFTQAVIALSYYYSFACIPFVILWFTGVHRRRRKVEVLCDAKHH